MSSPTISQYVKATVTAISRSGSGTTTTFDFTNRTDELQLGGNGRAVLKSVSGIGMTVGQDGMPAEQTGSIVIRDAPEAWGEERRFIDEMAAWTPIQQAVSIYIAQEDLDSNVAAYPAVTALTGYSSFIGLWDFNGTTTVDSQNRISSVDDYSPGGNDATQSTDGNKPVLTRSDNQENLFLQSEALGTSWTATRSNVTSNAVADPYTAAVTVDKLYDDATAGATHELSQSQRVITGIQYRISAICKTAGRDISFRFGDTGFTANSYAHFNLTAGTVSSVSGGATALITPLGSGWYLCEAFATCIASTYSIAMTFYLATPAGTTSYNGDSASGVYLGRCQLQETSSDSTYIATTTYKAHKGVNGQKAAFFDGTDDYLLANGVTTALSGTDKPFTLFAVVRPYRTAGSAQTIANLGDSAQATFKWHDLYINANDYNSYRRGDSGAAVTISNGTPTAATHVLAWAFTGTTLSLYVDGVTIYSGTACDTADANFNRYGIGAYVMSTIGEYFEGKMSFLGLYSGSIDATTLTVWQDYLSARYLETPATTPLSYSKIFEGICTSYSKTFDGESDETTLNISSAIFPPVRLGYIVGDTISGAQTRTVTINKGQALPFLFGTSVQTPAVQVVGGSTPVWGIASYFKSSSGVTLTYSGVTSYIARDIDGTYRSITNGSGSTASMDNVATGSTYPTPQGLTERAVFMDFNSTFEEIAYIIVNGRWRFKGQNDGGITPTGYIYFSMYEYEGFAVDSNGLVTSIGRPGKEVATATVNKDDYLASVRGASDFWVDFVWDRPVVTKCDGNAPYLPGYLVSMRLSSYDTSTTDFVDGGNNGSVRACCTRTSRGEWSLPSGSVSLPPVELFALTFAEFSASDSSDRGCVAFGVQTTTTRTVTGYANPEMAIDLMVELPGLKDNGAGAITGSASAIIKYPHHVAKALTMDYNGTDFSVSTRYNSTTYATRNEALFSASATMYRLINGSLDGGLDLSQMLAQLMNETACKLIQLTDGTVALWAWGYNQAAQATFTMENAKVTGFQSLDVSSVINRINVAYDERIRNVSGALVAKGKEAAYFDKAIEYSSSLLTQSRAVYGTRDIKELQFQLLADATSVANVAEYYARSFDHPHWVVNLEVPFWDFYARELMDTVNVCHPSLPSYYGTAASARLPTYSGAECSATIAGDYNVRAQNYVGHIVGKTINWSDGEMPILSLDIWLVQPLHPNATI